MFNMTEIRYFDSEEDNVSWVPVQVAEIEVEKDGKKLFLSASPAGVDYIWGFYISEKSIVSILEDDPDADFQDCIIEKYESLKEVLDSDYFYEFINLASKAAEIFGQNAISIN